MFECLSHMIKNIIYFQNRIKLNLWKIKDTVNFKINSKIIMNLKISLQ
jgi:hypothetical protein